MKEAKELLERHGNRAPKWAYEWSHVHEATMEGFLELCEYSAKFFIQDVSYMYDDINEHPIFSTPLFTSPEFFQFHEEHKKALHKYRDEVNSQRQSEGVIGPQTDVLKALLKQVSAITGKISSMTHKVDEMFKTMIYRHSEPVFEGEDLEIIRQTANIWQEDEEDHEEPVEHPTNNAATTKAEQPTPAQPSNTVNYFGSQITAPYVSPMQQAQSPPPLASTKPRGVDLTNPRTWPLDTPQWALKKPIRTQWKTVEEVVKEYFEGIPHPPGLRQLEEHYGREALQAKRTEAKRNKTAPIGKATWKGTKARNTAFSKRLAFYHRLEAAGNPKKAQEWVLDFMRTDPVIRDKCHQLGITNYSQPNNPSIFNCIFRRCTELKDGYNERSNAAKIRKRKRSTDDECSQDDEEFSQGDNLECSSQDGHSSTQDGHSCTAVPI